MKRKMIPFKRNNTSLFRNSLNEPYLIINIVLAGVIMLILVYSGIFSAEKNNYPVPCIHEELTGEQCSSCGISHSFSLILKGRISEALQWNSYGLRIFIFFVAQIFLRIIFSVFHEKFPAFRLKLVFLDSVGSGLLFLLAFWPFISGIIRNLKLLV